MIACDLCGSEEWDARDLFGIHCSDMERWRIPDDLFGNVELDVCPDCCDPCEDCGEPTWGSATGRCEDCEEAA